MKIKYFLEKSVIILFLFVFVSLGYTQSPKKLESQRNPAKGVFYQHLADIPVEYLQGMNMCTLEVNKKNDYGIRCSRPGEDNPFDILAPDKFTGEYSLLHPIILKFNKAGFELKQCVNYLSSFTCIFKNTR